MGFAAEVNVEVAFGLVDEHLGEHLPDAGVLVAWQSARGFVLSDGEGLLGTDDAGGDEREGDVDIDKHPPLTTVGEEDDDVTLNEGGDDGAEFVTHEFCLLAFGLLGIAFMHALVEFVGAPCVVEHEGGGDGEQGHCLMEGAYYPSDESADSHHEPVYPSGIEYSLPELLCGSNDY